MNTEKRNLFTVAQLTFAIKGKLEPFFRNIYVKGEVSNLKKHSSGHIYFSLKDETAQISCALFSRNASALERLPKDGDEITAYAEISVYPPRGNYQLIVRSLDFQGSGELLKRLHQLKKILEERGWLDPAIKKPLPLLPQKIGIVTSETGAAIQDMIHVLTRRFANVHIILNPASVQGENAKYEISQAIKEFNEYHLVDVIIVGRGGGSLEDLWAFNEEVVARAIYESKIPIISAVGHETDFSISDFVADVRAPTPSAAAEIVIQEKTILIKRLDNLRAAITKHIANVLFYYRSHLRRIKQSRCLIDPTYLFRETWQSIDEKKELLDDLLKNALLQRKHKLELFHKQLHHLNPLHRFRQTKQLLQSHHMQIIRAIKNQLLIKRDRLEKLISHLKSIDPKNLLKKGYSILFSKKDNSLILSTKNIAKDDMIVAKIADGTVQATVTTVEGYEK